MEQEPTQRDAGPAASYEHDHPPVGHPDEKYERQQSLGARVADRIAALVGSWPFIIVQSVLLVVWMAINAYLAIAVHRNPAMLHAWDPYPFILLNLMLSFQAAYTGPVVMMSQNRQSARDRVEADTDYDINVKAEQEVMVIIAQLVHNERLLVGVMDRLGAIEKRVGPDLPR